MKIERLTREAFAAFGDVITKEGVHHYPINNGTTERYHDLAQIDVADSHGKPLVSLMEGQPRQFPLKVSEFIVIDRGGAGSNCEEVRLGEPVTISETDLHAVTIDQGSNFGMPKRNGSTISNHLT